MTHFGVWSSPVVSMERFACMQAWHEIHWFVCCNEFTCNASLDLNRHILGLSPLPPGAKLVFFLWRGLLTLRWCLCFHDFCPFIRNTKAQIAPAAPIIECGCAGMFTVLPPHTSQLDCLFVIIYCWSNFMYWRKHKNKPAQPHSILDQYWLACWSLNPRTAWVLRRRGKERKKEYISDREEKCRFHGANSIG